AVAALRPCAVDGNELRVVDEGLDHGIRVVPAPCRVEPQFDLADRIFIRLAHDDLSRLAAVHSPRDFLQRLIFCPARPITAQISRESVTCGSKKPTPDQQNLDWCPWPTRLREYLEGVGLSNRSLRQHWPAKDFRRSVKPLPAQSRPRIRYTS